LFKSELLSRNALYIDWSVVRSLLGEVQPLLQSRSQQLKALMDEHGLEELPDTEELWEVPQPRIIMPVKTSVYMSVAYV